MSDNRGVRAKKNIATSLLSQLVLILCGFIVPRLMIGAFGSEVYGATTSITQFLGYITLLEGGIGSVARAALYHPLAHKDQSALNSIINEIKRFFRVIAWVFLGYVVILAFSFKSISDIQCLDWISTFLLVVVISISTFGQYFIGISNSILLQASQKLYITNIVSIVATIINTILTVVLITLDCNVIIVKLVSSCIFFMRPVILWIYVKRNFLLDSKFKPDKTKKYLTQKRTGLGQHLAFFLHTNTDVVVLTVFSDLKSVAVYAVYNMVISNLQNLTTSFSSGMESIFGDMYAKKEHKTLQSTFVFYETLISIVSVALFSTAMVLILPFVKLYTAGISDADYIQPILALIMIMISLSYCLRTPYHSMIIAAGHFKQTSIAAYGEAIINIALSIGLVFKFDLNGVAIATLIATWFRFIFYLYYLSKNILYIKIMLFVKRLAVNILIIALSLVIGNFFVHTFDINNYFMWAICGLVTFVSISILTLGLNFLFYKNNCCALITKFIKKK